MIEESGEESGCCVKCLRGEFYGSLRNEQRRARGVVMWHRQMDIANHVGEVLPRVGADLSTGVWDLPKPGVWYCIRISLFFPYEHNTEQVQMPAPVGSGGFG